MLWRYLTEDNLYKLLGKRADRIAANRDAERPGPPQPQTPPDQFPRVQQLLMGCQFEVYLTGSDRDTLIASGEEALHEVARVEQRLSHYIDESDTTRINRQAAIGPVRVQPELYRLLVRCFQLSVETGGAFDITAGPLIRAWGFYRGEGQVPTDQDLAEARSRVGYRHVMLDPAELTIQFDSPGMEIHFGAIGKGYALDCARDHLKLIGVRDAVLHGGQSTILAMGDDPTTGSGWTFKVHDPRDKTTLFAEFHLHNESLSATGNYEQFFIHEGVRYGHVFDPRTGRPVRDMLGVWVAAPSAAESDALSTAFFVLGVEGAQNVCQNRPGVRVLLVKIDDFGSPVVTKIGF